MIDLSQAEDVWNVAHTIFVKSQSGKAQGINENAGGNGDSNHHLIWVADVRKLVDGELNTFLLDCVYGDSPHNPNPESRRGARDALRAFSYQLSEKPSVLGDFEKYRRLVFE